MCCHDRRNHPHVCEEEEEEERVRGDAAVESETVEEQH